MEILNWYESTIRTFIARISNLTIILNIHKTGIEFKIRTNLSN